MLDVESVLDLPAQPADLAGQAAAAWVESLIPTTYEPLAPDRFPAHLDRRVLVLDARLALLADDEAAAREILRRPELMASRQGADLRHAVARWCATLLHGPGAQDAPSAVVLSTSDSGPAEPKEPSA